jgi:hypothetical protein
MSTSSSSAGSSLTESSPRHSAGICRRNFLLGKVSQNVTFAIASIRLIIVDFACYDYRRKVYAGFPVRVLLWNNLMATANNATEIPRYLTCGKKKATTTNECSSNIA